MDQQHGAAARATWSDVTVEHHGVGLLRNFSATADDGQVLGVIGSASEGLSVTLLALAGRYGAVRGSVAILGAPESVAVIADPLTAAIDDPLMRVVEAVAEVARVPAGTSARSFTEWSLGAAGLADRAARLIGDLTVVERIRLGVAVATASGATVIVLDLSPIASDPSVGSLLTLLRQLANSGRLVIVGAPVRHESFDFVLPIPAATEVPA